MTRSDNASQPELEQAPWVQKILCFRQYENGEYFICKYPTTHNQSEIFETDLVATINSLVKELNHGKLFWRCRDRSLSGFSFKDVSDEEIGTAITNATIFYNCYVSVISENSKDNDELEYPNECFKEIVVLISRWPFRHLAYDMLNRLHEALRLQTQAFKDCRQSSINSTGASIFSSPRKSDAFSFSSPGGSCSVEDDDNDRGMEIIVSSVLEVAFNQVSSWPPVSPRSFVNLNFLGDVLNFVVPSECSLEELNPRLTPMLLSTNILEILGPLGLIQHLWTIWELVITGQDIVVVTTNPVHCCEVVLAIASLLEPAGYVGDIRPYIGTHDKDLLVLSATAQLKVIHRHERMISSDEVEITTAFKKLAARNRSMVVGVIDIESLSELEDFSAALFIDSTDFMSCQEKKRKFDEFSSFNIGVDSDGSRLENRQYGGYQNEMSDSVFKGLRNRNAAIEKFVPINYTNDNKISFVLSKKKSGLARFFNFKRPNVPTAETPSFRTQYEQWMSQTLKESDGRKETWLLYRSSCTAIPLARIVKRIQHLHPEDRLIIGEKILRDNLHDITTAFLGSLDGSSATPFDMQSSRRVSIEGKTPDDQDALEELLSQRRSLEMAREAELKGMWRQGFDDIILWIKEIPMWIVTNFATVVLWCIYLFVFGFLAWLGIPSVLVMIVAYLVNVPERAPDAMTAFIEFVLPIKAIFGLSKKVLSTSTEQFASQDTAEVDHNHIALSPTAPVSFPDLNGIWKRVKVENYEAFLAAQGVNYLQRKVAASIAMQHMIVIDSTHTKLHLEEKGGPVDIESDYDIDPLKFKLTHILKADFEDTVSWDYSYKSPQEVQEKLPPAPKLRIVKRRLPNCPYELRIWRWIESSSKGNYLRVRALYHPFKGVTTSKNKFGSKEVESFCSFEYVGSSSFLFPSDQDDYALRIESDSNEEENEDVVAVPEDRAPSNIVEEEIYSTVSIDASEVVLSPAPITSRKSWFHRRLSSKTLLKDDNLLEDSSHSTGALLSSPSNHSLKKLNTTSTKEEKKHLSSKSIDDNNLGLEINLPTSISSSKLSQPLMTDFSGVWIRTRAENFEAFAEATGLGPLQRIVAAQMSLTHIITMNPPELTAFRLQERGGPLSTDFTVTINSDRDVAVMINGKRLLHRAWYMEPNNLIMFRRAEDGSFEHVLMRSIDAESSASQPQLILRSIHRNLISGHEVEAISFFTKLSASPNPPPAPENLANGKKYSPRGFIVKKSSGHNNSSNQDTSQIYDNSSIVEVNLEDADVDCEEDDDDAAVRKMHSISSAQKERQNQNIKAMHRHM